MDKLLVVGRTATSGGSPLKLYNGQSRISNIQPIKRRHQLHEHDAMLTGEPYRTRMVMTGSPVEECSMLCTPPVYVWY